MLPGHYVVSAASERRVNLAPHQQSDSAGRAKMQISSWRKRKTLEKLSRDQSRILLTEVPSRAKNYARLPSMADVVIFYGSVISQLETSSRLLKQVARYPSHLSKDGEGRKEEDVFNRPSQQTRVNLRSGMAGRRRWPVKVVPSRPTTLKWKRKLALSTSTACRKDNTLG